MNSDGKGVWERKKQSESICSKSIILRRVDFLNGLVSVFCIYHVSLGKKYLASSWILSDSHYKVWLANHQRQEPKIWLCNP